MEGSIDGTDFAWNLSHFTGRWSCDSAWSFFDDLIKNPDYKHQGKHLSILKLKAKKQRMELGIRIKCFKLPGEEALPTI